MSKVRFRDWWHLSYPWRILYFYRRARKTGKTVRGSIWFAWRAFEEDM